MGLTRGARSEVAIGRPAPDFEGTASDGKSYRLSEYRGNYVVLEWYNTGCPFVKKHYDSGNMQRLQQKYALKGVIWFSIVSSAPGKQGYLTATAAEQDRGRRGMKSIATLLDPQGKLGRLYEAKTTPHMFIIDPQGVLIYKGAIDDRNSTDMSDISGAKNFVELALEEALAGKSVSRPSTRPYGCSVKY
jgi:hypothetical protein